MTHMNTSNPKSLVTGAAGFLGGTICRQLIERGDAVRAFVLPNDPAMKFVPGAAEICEGDLTDMDSLDKACGIVGSKNIVIIPSSVHEILVVPADMVTAEELSTMIGDVNESLVQNTERLSDHPYAYDGHSLSMDHHLQLVSVILRVEFFRQHNRYNIVHLHITPNSNLLDGKILTPDIFLINFVISCTLDIIVISIAPVHRTYGKSAHKIHIGLVSHIFCSFQML